MEANLKKLFDFQQFEHNSRLEAIISQTQKRYMNTREISDDELTMINAAGSPDMMRAAIENMDKQDL